MVNRPYWGGRIAIGNRTLVARTCVACGLILGSKHFDRKRGGWASICTPCRSKQYRELHHDKSVEATTRINIVNQTLSLESATRKGQHWTLKELDAIVEAINAGLTYREIAILVNRSYYSISQTIHSFGLKDNWPSREIWIIQHQAQQNEGL